MPLAERGGPRANEEAKESKEVRPSEATPVPTEPQVRRPEATEGRGLGLPHSPDPVALSPRLPSSWIC